MARIQGLADGSSAIFSSRIGDYKMARKPGTRKPEAIPEIPDRTPAVAKIAKRARGPSASDPKRREEFRRASESNKGREGA